MDLIRRTKYPILGVALTQGPGLQTPTLSTLFTELGPDLSAVPTAKHFAAWLGLCPHNRVRGGRVLAAKIPKSLSENSMYQPY